MEDVSNTLFWTLFLTFTLLFDKIIVCPPSYVSSISSIEPHWFKPIKKRLLLLALLKRYCICFVILPRDVDLKFLRATCWDPLLFFMSCFMQYIKGFCWLNNWITIILLVTQISIVLISSRFKRQSFTSMSSWSKTSTISFINIDIDVQTSLLS